MTRARYPHLPSLALGTFAGALLVALVALPARANDPPVPPRPDLKLLPEHRPGQLIDDAYALPTPPDALRAPDPPASHTPAFARDHAAQARANPGACASCHAETSCRDCHRATLKPLAIHPPGYLSLHATEATRQADACTTCHTTQAFCRDCHNAARAGAFGAAKPPPLLRFHPPSWLGLNPGPDHATEARRNLLACASCHAERDCLGCHVNVNPHPPGFLATCRALATRNPRPCLQCHADTSTIRRCLPQP